MHRGFFSGEERKLKMMDKLTKVFFSRRTGNSYLTCRLKTNDQVICLRLRLPRVAAFPAALLC